MRIVSGHLSCLRRRLYLVQCIFSTEFHKQHRARGTSIHHTAQKRKEIAKKGRPQTGPERVPSLKGYIVHAASVAAARALRALIRQSQVPASAVVPSGSDGPLKSISTSMCLRCVYRLPITPTTVPSTIGTYHRSRHPRDAVLCLNHGIDCVQIWARASRAKNMRQNQ